MLFRSNIKRALTTVERAFDTISNAKEKGMPKTSETGDKDTSDVTKAEAGKIFQDTSRQLVNEYKLKRILTDYIVEETIMSKNKEYLSEKKKWIQKALHKSRKGEFTSASKKADMSVSQYAKHVLAHPEKFSKKRVGQAKFAKRAQKGFED